MSDQLYKINKLKWTKAVKNAQGVRWRFTTNSPILYRMASSSKKWTLSIGTLDWTTNSIATNELDYCAVSRITDNHLDIKAAEEAAQKHYESELHKFLDKAYIDFIGTATFNNRKLDIVCIDYEKL